MAAEWSPFGAQPASVEQAFEWAELAIDKARTHWRTGRNDHADVALQAAEWALAWARQRIPPNLVTEGRRILEGGPER